MDLGYRPNAIGRSLAEGRTRMLACLSPNLTDYTFASIIEGAEAEARRHGYFLVASSAPDEANFAIIVDRLVSSRRTEGILVINPFIDGRRKYFLPEFPMVLIGSPSDDSQVGSVSLDNTQAGYLATNHLLSLGHRRIACISGPQIEDCVVDRMTGYKMALLEAGLQICPAYMGRGDWSASSAYAVVTQWLAEKLPFTAIFSQNDTMAIGAIRAMRAVGIRIPQDISVIGIDDMPLSSYFDPPLTTIRQDTYAIGQEAARNLVQVIENLTASKVHQRMPVELVIRQSTQAI